MSTPETYNPRLNRPPLKRDELRRYARLRGYSLTPLELCVWLLRFHERASFAQIGAELDMTAARVQEIDRSMTARALASRGQRQRPTDEELNHVRGR